MQLNLNVVDVALGSSQLVLSVLQSGAGVVEVVSLEITEDILLKKLSAALLNVLDSVVLGLHLASVFLQAEA
jgi:hypothetical protein